MSYGLGTTLLLRLDDLMKKEKDNENFVKLYNKLMKLNDTLCDFNRILDISEARKEWCKTCNNSEVRLPNSPYTTCSFCALTSIFNHPACYKGDVKDIKKRKQFDNEINNVLKVLEEI